MSNEPVTRIGRGVPVRQQPKPSRWFGIKPEFVIAASVVIATAMMVVATLVFDGGDRSAQPPVDTPSANSQPGDVQIECAAIKHEYVAWKRADADFASLATVKNRLVADMQMGHLAEAGKSFAKAASGYSDQPSKHLALSISVHNYDLSVINLELTAADKITAESIDKARASRARVEKDYESFLALTCA